MKRFDGCLICTDLDGTFTNMAKTIPENLKAAKYFMEQGGRFTIATGRAPSYISRLEGLEVNAPLVCLNGTQIFDTAKDHVLLEAPMKSDIIELLCTILHEYHSINHMYLYFRDGSSTDAAPDNLHNVCAADIMKTVMVFDREDEALRCKYENSVRHPELKFMRSWNVGLEIIDREAGKDVCVKWLKERLGADTLICMGDFENDEAMLSAADISAVPANGLPYLKARADHVLCEAPMGCLADLISRL